MNKISSLLSENAQCGKKGKHQDYWLANIRNTREKWTKHDDACRREKTIDCVWRDPEKVSKTKGIWG